MGPACIWIGSVKGAPDRRCSAPGSMADAAHGLTAAFMSLFYELGRVMVDPVFSHMREKTR